MTDTIHIAMNLDENYAPHCGVTMVSVLHHNRSNKIRFHILGLDLSHDSKARLGTIASKYGSEITFYDVDEKLVCDLPNMGEGIYIKPSSYIRLYLTDFIPADIDKILYLDCDLIVRHNLRELWETDIEGVALAAVENRIRNLDRGFRPYDYTRYKYFNAGVLLVNITYWRKNNLKERFEDFIAKYYDRIDFHDQDVLNGVLYDSKTLLPEQWNMMDFHLNKSVFALEPAIYEKYGRNPYIVHFTSSTKPWNTIKYRPYFEEYHKLRRMTPWGGIKIDAGVMTKQTKHALKRLLGLDKYLFDRQMKRALKKLKKQESL